jgi:uncharacterized coiled-coil protein SlyX
VEAKEQIARDRAGFEAEAAAARGKLAQATEALRRQSEMSAAERASLTLEKKQIEEQCFSARDELSTLRLELKRMRDRMAVEAAAGHTQIEVARALVAEEERAALRARTERVQADRLSHQASEERERLRAELQSVRDRAEKERAGLNEELASLRLEVRATQGKVAALADKLHASKQSIVEAGEAQQRTQAAQEELLRMKEASRAAQAAAQVEAKTKRNLDFD